MSLTLPDVQRIATDLAGVRHPLLDGIGVTKRQSTHSEGASRNISRGTMGRRFTRW
jgi:hypothetical protein